VGSIATGRPCSSRSRWRTRGSSRKTQLNLDAQAAFRNTLKDAGYDKAKLNVVRFRAKFVDKATGKESTGSAAVYAISRAQAKRIVWANEDSIDWENYRTVLAPGI
jgi:hypothetical protein